MALWLLIAACPGFTSKICAQQLFSLGAGSTLQVIEVGNLKVRDIVTISPAMSDIAFHPDGSLYGVSQNSIYLIDTLSGNSQLIKELPGSYGWLLGLTIDYKGVFYMSGLGPVSDYVIRYDPESDVAENLGELGWRHWDLEFYNGQLYAAGGTDDVGEGFLIAVDLQDLSESKFILDYGIQAYGLTSFNDHCGGSALIVTALGGLRRLYPTMGTFDNVAISSPLYLSSDGATSSTAFMGSLPGVQITSIEVAELPCHQDATTSITVHVPDSLQGIEYSIDGINYQGSPVFHDIIAGIYRVYVRDAEGCLTQSEIVEITVKEPQFEVDITPAHCNQDNGIITLTPLFPEDSLTFSMDGMIFDQSPEYDALTDSIYTIHVQDNSGCVATSEVVIPRIEKVGLKVVTTPEHCGSSDGTIDVTARDGVPPYTYSLSSAPGQSNSFFANLHAATYNVRVTDSLGCQSAKLGIVEASEAPQIENLSIVPAHCDIADGSVRISATSEHNGLRFSIDGINYSTDSLFTLLTTGTYSLSVLDPFGCESSTSFVIPSLDGPVIEDILTTVDYCNFSNGSIEVIASSAGQLEYSIDGIDYYDTPFWGSLTHGTYNVVVRDEFGCITAADVEVLNDPGPYIEHIDLVDATCGIENGSIEVVPSATTDLMYSLNGTPLVDHPMFQDLPPGEYSVFIESGQGCRDSAYVIIDALPYIEIKGVIAEEASCHGNDGSAELLTNLVNAEVQFTVDGISFNGEPSFNGLVPGSYTAIAIDANGCTDSIGFDVGIANPLRIESLEIAPDYCDESNGAIILEVDPDINISINNQQIGPSRMLTDLRAGSYFIQLSDDADCKLDTIVEIPDVTCSVFVPNAFSPNGDGANDLLTPSVDPLFAEIEQFEIYDRWGHSVYSCRSGCEWDGSSGSDAAPPGVYVYYLQLRESDGTVSNSSGDITLLR